jgi:hypothetical protein
MFWCRLHLLQSRLELEVRAQSKQGGPRSFTHHLISLKGNRSTTMRSLSLAVFLFTVTASRFWQGIRVPHWPTAECNKIITFESQHTHSPKKQQFHFPANFLFLAFAKIYCAVETAAHT